MSSLRENIGDAERMEQACKKLSSMVSLHGTLGLLSKFELYSVAGENALLVGRAGAIDAVVAAMMTHVDKAGLSEHACHAMSNICMNGAVSA